MILVIVDKTAPLRGGAVSRKSFDEILGDSTKRYLSHRYRLVTHSIDVDSAVASRLTTSQHHGITASVVYPDRWSEKPGGAMSPHLSTLDGMTLGATLSNLRARTSPPIEPAGGPSIVTAIRIRAGAAPETDLLSIPVAWKECIEVDKRITAMRFGRMSVTVEVEPRSKVPSLTSIVTEQIGLDKWVNPSHHDSVAPEIESVLVDLDRTQGTLVSEHAATDSSRELALGYEDFLRLSAQAAQILIYSVDGIDRNISTNVWMRRAEFTLNRNARLHNEPAYIRSSIDTARSLRSGDRRIRSFDMVFQLDDFITCTAALAYTLT